MSESTSKSVECPLCGEEFDPTVAGGWCTNSDCGEWQFDGDVETAASSGADNPLFDDEPESSEGDAESDEEDGFKPPFEAGVDDETSDEAAGDGLDSGDDPLAEAGDEGDDALEATDESSAEAPEPADLTDDESEDADAAADTGEPTTDPAEDEADGDGDVDVDEDADAEDAADELDACPGCEAVVGPDDSFCPSCGEDLEAHRGDADSLDACPDCEADVDPDDSFCAECGADLDAADAAQDEEPPALTACPSCDTDVDADDSFCPSCGEDLEAHRSGEADEATGADLDALTLSAYGRSVVVEDDDTVGREIRSLLNDAGRPEEDAVRIHREHVRFVEENGRFYVVDLGENPTALNGRAMEKGDRESVAPGDELELSDVVTLTVEAA